ncbi:hypothetical protein J3Q64DRAFT_1780275 [Phycomyces blakesleeanus]
MVASELPFEITRRIADFLQPRDKIQCCFVCKAWLPAIQESLLETIVINDYGKFAKSVGLSGSTSNFLQRYGHSSRKLHIGQYAQIFGEELLALQRCLPHIQYFKWSTANIDEYTFIDHSGWKLWEFLTDLEVKVWVYVPHTAPSLFYSLFSKIRPLRRLEFKYMFNTGLYKHTVGEFDALNNSLPELTRMALGAQLLSITLHELSMIKNVKPLQCLKSLEVNLINSTYEWLYYIAIKFPNISILKTIIFASNTASEQSLEVAKMFARIPYPFQQLEEINVRVELGSEQIFIDFVKQLYLFKAPIKTLCLSLGGSVQMSAFSRDVFESRNIFSSTLEKVTIKASSLTLIFWAYTDNLEHFPHLVDLNIQVEDSTSEIDILLDRCPSLKTFRFDSGTLRRRLFDRVTSEFSTNHGLRELTLTSTHIVTDTLNYISHRCKKLKSMFLENVYVAKPKSEDTKTNCIDMSSTSFIHLSIGSVMFVDPSTKNIINIFALSSTMNPIGNTWVYCVPDVECRTRREPKGWIIGGEEAKYVEDFFRNFSEIVEKEYTEEQLYKDEYARMVPSWKDNLNNGYAMFKYGSLINLNIIS